MENNRNFKIFMNWEDIHKKEEARKILKGISDITFIYFISASKQNPERVQIIDERTGEVKEVYKEPYRYLYENTFSKTEVAKELNISRPTLYSHIEQLMKIGLIEEGEGWDKTKNKNVKVWYFPHIKAVDFIPADTADFFTRLCPYHSDFVKKDQYKNIIHLIFNLKRLDSLSTEPARFTIHSLLRDLRLANDEGNRLRLFDYLILLSGLDIIRFSRKEIKKGATKRVEYSLDYFNDEFNEKMRDREDLQNKALMENFIQEERFRNNFDINIVKY